ncbi:MAG TPA: carboxypeptidase-like regulatory domain-containing protein [Pyrinomonadaceae bacterium]|nr:carboxypeptidase-like regulatory domain-containing protein [Pyrinomonadaceae bacterium]
MRQLFIASLLVFASFGVTAAQAQNASTQQEIPNMGRAPREADGVGRLDLRVVDANGNPVEGVRADLKSKRSNGFECESWNWTDARGVSVLPPLHMGRLQLTLKAKGYETLKLNVNAADLDQPLRVTMVRKK